jgi:hypothetical protein
LTARRSGGYPEAFTIVEFGSHGLNARIMEIRSLVKTFHDRSNLPFTIVEFTFHDRSNSPFTIVRNMQFSVSRFELGALEPFNQILNLGGIGLREFLVVFGHQLFVIQIIGTTISATSIA